MGEENENIELDNWEEENEPEIEKELPEPEIEEELEEDPKPRPETPGGSLKAALREERENVKRLREQMKKYDSLWERLDKWEQERIQPKETAPEEVPDFNLDPTGHLKHQTEKLNSKVQEVTQTQEQIATQQKQAAQMQMIGQQIAAHEQSFATAKQDYYAALNYVRQVQKNTLLPVAKAQGMGEAEVMQAIAQNEFNMAAQALQAGLNPAEYVYTMAKNYGYKPAEKSDEDLDRLEKGIQHAGPRGGRKITKDAVDDLEFAEFENFIQETFTQH